MDRLYMVREECVRFFSKYESYIQPVLKLVIGLLLFYVINARFGYMKTLDRTVVYLALGVSCCVLPSIAIVVEAAGLILLHLYALSPVVCVLTAGLLFLMYIIYYRFTEDDGFYTSLTPLAYMVGIPYVMPIAAGFFKKPYRSVSIVCGTIIYYFLEGIRKNETVLARASSKNTVLAKVHVVMNQFLANKEMFLMCATVILATCSVYVIRRLAIDHAWTIALWIGAAVQFVLVLSGYLFWGIDKKISSLVIGIFVSLALGWGMKFFCFHLDYARTERVQFEDDEYYYYVKAVPKILYQVPPKKRTKTKKDDV